MTNQATCRQARVYAYIQKRGWKLSHGSQYCQSVKEILMLNFLHGMSKIWSVSASTYTQFWLSYMSKTLLHLVCSCLGRTNEALN